MKKQITFLFVLVLLSCSAKKNKEKQSDKKTEMHTSSVVKIIEAANITNDYLPLLKGKKVGVVANQTSVIFKAHNKPIHLVDSLMSLKINIVKAFAPEHGFRGVADAGEHVSDGVDKATGLPVISLYGKNRKPAKAQLQNIDVMLFDIQDVGVRFYTYISTLHYVMEACAEQNIPVVVLDRPNPNGHYVDGPILEKEFKSFVGMHSVPIVYGMTIGEYAKMINGEGWLKNKIKCNLTVVPLKNYTHASTYNLPIKPSPNLPNATSINLYPSLCFFEGTNVSCGRGTEMQFQIFGSPYLSKKYFPFQFIPQPNFGAKNPKNKGEINYGRDLRAAQKLGYINLNWLIEAYNHTTDKKVFFNAFFSKLAGTETLQKQIIQGMSVKEIKAGWQNDLEKFKNTRSKYLLYP
ncbi:exo-beta-N-acetylmuramidase NamZ domain-containing protein [Tenacibaculum sp. UWU-22]|uniref:exo-beta-N-acetylmuramidase NamZ family protein n=1 Tax=Tenacibaculum sp. UWU-22 TaxID=3234187 RepID=UPI0034DB5D41